MAEVPLSGRLEEFSFPEVAGALSRERKTGTLTVSSGDRSRKVVFYEGSPVAVLSDSPSDHIARFLAAKQKISKEQAAEIQGIPETKDSLQSVEFLTKDVLTWGVKFRFVNLAYDLFRWVEGRYEFEEGPPPKEYFLMKLPVPSLVMKGMKHVPAKVLASKIPEDYQVAPGPLPSAEAGALGEEENSLLAACREGSAVGEVLQGGGLEPERARGLLFSFLALGLIDVAPPAPAAEPAAREVLEEPVGEPAPVTEPIGEPEIEKEAGPEPEPAFEIERHSYEEEGPAPPPAGEPAPLFGEFEAEAPPAPGPEEAPRDELPPLGGEEQAAPPPLGRQNEEGSEGGLAPIGFGEVELSPPGGAGEEGPPALEIPPLSPDLPPPPWHGEEKAAPGGEAEAGVAEGSPFSPPKEEAPPRPMERTFRARALKTEPPKPRRTVPARLILLVALGGAALLVGAGLLTGSSLFKSPLTPLPPIPPAEQKGKAEMAEGIPVPALPKAPAPGKMEVPETSPAVPATAQAPVAPRPPPAPAPVARSAGGTFEQGMSAYRNGDLDNAAAIWKTHLEESGAAFTISVVAACQSSTVDAAFDRFGADRGLFVLPLKLSGRNCYRVVLGTFADEQAAKSALLALPSHLRQDLEVRAAKGL